MQKNLRIITELQTLSLQNYRFSIKAQNLDMILVATKHLLNHEIVMKDEEKLFLEKKYNIYSFWLYIKK